MAKIFKGRSTDAGGPILSAKFWKNGSILKGRVVRAFQTAQGTCYLIESEAPMTVDGSLVSPVQSGPVMGRKWSVGALKGFQMALDAAEVRDLFAGDLVTITCVGEEDSGKESPLVLFEVEVKRA
jgi:hypothetical protein